MLGPCAKSNLKRKRVQKQSQNFATGENQEKDVKKDEITPLASSQKNVTSPAIFILDNASLKKGLVRKRKEDAQFLLKQKKNLNDYE